jgi:hypothetical protein
MNFLRFDGTGVTVEGSNPKIATGRQLESNNRARNTELNVFIIII